MFLNTLYTILEKQITDHSAFYSVEIDAGHPLYQGHFPGSPVTPGVVFAEVVKELLTQATGRQMRMSTMRQLKFLAMHNPLKVPVVEFDLKWTDDYEVQATGKFAETVFFKLSASYQSI